MNTNNAKIILENLLERIENNPQTGRKTLPGIISDREYAAIDFAINVLRKTSPDENYEEHPISTISETSTGSTAQLELRCLDYIKPEDPNVILCIDFGTAMSKAVVTKDADDEILPLPLGRKSGEPVLVFPMSSTLFISRTGRIYFGYSAIRESLAEESKGGLSRKESRSRFDSSKQRLSQGMLADPSRRNVDETINPTEYTFTEGDLILLILSFLTDLACTELEEKGISRYVRRRFAMPFWSGDRAEWAKSYMTKLLAKAQIVADTFSGQWANGLEAERVQRILNDVNNCEKFPEYLIDNPVFEAAAAASSSFPYGSGKRELYMIMDVGAGTVDYGLYAVVTPKNDTKKPKIFQAKGTMLALRKGGDTIDGILRLFILERERINEKDADFDYIDRDLKLRIRTLKENLFQQGAVTYNLSNDSVGEVVLEDFLADRRMTELERVFRESFEKSLMNAEPSWITKLSQSRLTVVLTGGGARLPILTGLSTSSFKVHGVNLQCKGTAVVPEWFTEKYSEWETEFPQLAVAIGGAEEDPPDICREYGEIGISDTKIVGLKPEYK